MGALAPARRVVGKRFAIQDKAADLIGRGAMGDVYRGRDLQTDQVVAIKALKPDLVDPAGDMITRFIREGEALRQLNHPNIVTIIDTVKGEDAPLDNPAYFLVMAYVDGGSLHQLLEKEGRLPPRQALEIGLDLVDALTRAHRLGIIHRDLKPSNVLMASDGTPRLTDFGLAQMSARSSLTQAGAIIGTVDYLSPEACNGQILDKRTDIWSFGVLLWEMLAGRPPFRRNNLGATLTAILSDAPPDVRDFCPEVDDNLVHLLDLLLEKDPFRRIPSMRLVGAELETILIGRGSTLSETWQQPEPGAAQDRRQNQVAAGGQEMAEAWSTRQALKLVIDPGQDAPGKSVLAMTQEARRCLWLLGPARVDQIQKAHKEAQENVAGSVPRFRSQRTVGLLGYLATERRPVAREHLALLFWPDEAPSKGRANLRRELHNLAQILPDCWESDRQSLSFVPSAGTIVDLYQLLQLEAQERWGEAAELVGSEFLEGLNLDHNPEFENWLLNERERWRGRAEVVLRRVIEGHTRRGRYTDALHYAQRLLRLAAWDEETHRQIMRLLAWTGQRGTALRQFESCRRALREELDVEPASETIYLFQQIQAGQLDLPPQLPAFLTEEKARRGFEQRLFVGREGEMAQLDGFMDAALAGLGRVIFITGGPGRGKTALLDAFAQRAMERHPNLLVANGKCNAYSGLGDPYLPYRDVMAMLTGDVEGRWDAGAISRDHARRLWEAFSLVVQVLLDHGRHLLDVFVPGAALLSRSTAAGQAYAPWLPQLREQVKRRATGTEDVEQSQLFQQITNVLCTVAQEQPLLLILDDIQWADTASISLLFHLGRCLADVDSRLLIACAYRPEEVALGREGERHPLAKVLGEFKRTYGNVWVDVGRVEMREERRFVNALLDAEPNRLGGGFRAALFDRTGGHPLFTVELLRAMQDRGDLLKAAGTDDAWIEGPTLDWEVLPARVEAVIEERIDRLDPDLQGILTIASVEGELFTAQVVAKVQNVPERSLLHRLSQDLERRHRLAREQEEVYTGRKRISRYRFGHVLFQDYLYKRLSQGERRLLHGEVAAALEELYEGRLEEMAVQLAHHFYRAGDHHQAFHYFSLAGERAARLYASGEAITHYTRAIQLAERVSPEVVSLARLHRGRGLASETLGEFEQARVDHEATLKIAGAAGEHQVEWRALLDLGKLWRSRDYNKAHDCFEAALELARRTDDPAVLANSLNWMGNWYANNEKHLRAVEYHLEALKIVEQWEDRRELANTLDLLGIANLLGGDLNTSVYYYDRAIALFRELDDRLRLTNSLVGRATTVSALAWLVSVPAAPSPDATFDFKEALLIAGEIDSAPDQAWAHWSLGLLHTMHGHFGRAHKVMQSGLRIASEIGHREFVVASRHALGILYTELFAPDQARGQLEGALTLAGELHSATLFHDVSGALAGAYLMLGDQKLAQACLETVVSPQTPMDTVGKRYCWARRAELALAQDDPALASDITERLIASASGMSPGRVITFLWMLKAKALAANGRIEDAGAKDASTENALSLLQSAIENAQVSGERFLLWRVHASLGRLYQSMGHQEAAEKEFSAARTLIDEMAATVSDETLKDKFRQGAYSILE